MALAFFILAGNIMNNGGVTDQIFGFCKKAVGWIPGGLGHANVLASVIFAGMSGAAVADAGGLGAIEVKAMRDDGYDDEFSVAVTGASSIIGPIIPPSIPVVVYAVAASVSVGKLLIGGLLPGLVLALCMMVYIYFVSKKRGYPRHKFEGFSALGKSFIKSLPALLTPCIILGGILTGICTPTEASAVDMRGNLDTIKDAWPDGVGSPYLMKINPDMMPVAMVAVDYDGYDTVQISDYVNNELKNQLEGIDGVASVSTKGIVTQKENVIISQTKIDALNAKINDALNDKFGDAEKKISDAKKELQDNISKAEQGSDTIEQSINDLNSQQEEVAKQLADAQGKAQSGYTEILNAKMQLLDQQQSLI